MYRRFVEILCLFFFYFPFKFISIYFHHVKILLFMLFYMFYFCFSSFFFKYFLFDVTFIQDYYFKKCVKLLNKRTNCLERVLYHSHELCIHCWYKCVKIDCIFSPVFEYVSCVLFTLLTKRKAFFSVNQPPQNSIIDRKESQ